MGRCNNQAIWEYIDFRWCICKANILLLDFVLAVDSSHLCIAHLLAFALLQVWRNLIIQAIGRTKSPFGVTGRYQINEKLSLGTCYPILGGGTCFHIWKIGGQKKNHFLTLSPSTKFPTRDQTNSQNQRNPASPRQGAEEGEGNYTPLMCGIRFKATFPRPKNSQTTEPLQTGWLLAKLQSHHALYWSFLVTGTTKGKAKTSYRS